MTTLLSPWIAELVVSLTRETKKSIMLICSLKLGTLFRTCQTFKVTLPVLFLNSRQATMPPLRAVCRTISLHLVPTRLNVSVNGHSSFIAVSLSLQITLSRRISLKRVCANNFEKRLDAIEWRSPWSARILFGMSTIINPTMRWSRASRRRRTIPFATNNSACCFDERNPCNASLVSLQKCSFHVTVLF